MKTKRKKLTNFLKLGILFFGISLLLFNCEQRELTEEIETVSIDNKYQSLTMEDAIGFLNNFKSKGYSKKSTKGINLDIDINSLNLEEVENSDLSMPVFEATTKHIDIESKVFLIKVNDSLQGFLINRIPEKEGSSSKFSGVISVTDLEGRFINGYRVEDDIFITQFVKKNSSKNSNFSARMYDAEDPEDCDESLDPSSDFCDQGLDEIVIVASGGNSSNSNSNSNTGTGLNFNNSWGWSFPSSNIGGGGTGNSSNSSNKVNVFPCDDPIHGCDKECGQGYVYDEVLGECILVDKLITKNLNNPCIENIIKELQQKDTKNAIVPDLTGVSHLSQTILDLFDTSTNYNLTFEIKQLGSTSAGERNAQTTNVTGGWKITLDTDLVKNGTQLFMAKTLIHESMHAFIKYNLKTNRTSNLATDLNALYQKFKSQNNSSNLTHHEFMSQYVEALSYSLAAYDNHQQPNVYYKMLSWGGLETSTVYQALSNKTEIQNAINNERYGKSNAKGKKCD